MDVQFAGMFQMVEPPKDPQSDMVLRCRRFQESIGKWDGRITAYGAMPFCRPDLMLHHLDMGIQEASEAWDMLEGGWKHHKTKPKPADEFEVLSELVDVAHFVFNAYLYAGGEPDADSVAVLAARSKQELKLPTIGIEEVWGIGVRSWDRKGHRLRAMYGHGDGAHGADWEKETATRVNYLRSKIFEVASTVRFGMDQASGPIPTAPGYIYIEIVPWLVGAAAAIPSCDRWEVFYSAFVSKNEINFKRQAGGY